MTADERHDHLIFSIRGRLLLGMDRQAIFEDLTELGYSQGEIYLAYVAAELANKWAQEE